MQCQHVATCAFLENLRRTDPFTAETVVITYCDNNWYSCARYGLFQVMAADEVPDFLWPNDEEEAVEVIKIRSRMSGMGAANSSDQPLTQKQ